MPRTEALIDAYIDANLILLFAFAAWWCARTALCRSRLRHDFALRMRLGEALILVALGSPVLGAALGKAVSLWSPGTSLNAADLALAQFLNGHLTMSAERFAFALDSRDAFVSALARPGTLAMQVLVAALAVGAAISLLRLAGAVWRLRLILRQSYLLRRTHCVDLRVCDSVSVPFSFHGLRRRHVVLPSAMLATPADLHIALAHEFQHVRRGDTEWELALSLLRPLFFWNPAFHFWKRDLECLREMACDRAVLGRGRFAARDYADCLLAVCQRRLSQVQGRHPIPAATVPFIDIRRFRKGGRAANALRQRIAEIAEQRQPAAAPLAIWPVLAVAATLIVIGTSSLQRSGDWTHDRLMLSTIVNLERLESRNQGPALAGF